MVGINMSSAKEDPEEADELGDSEDPAVEALKRARKASGKSWSALGAALGYKHGYQGAKNILTGRKRFDDELKRKAAEFLGVPVDEFSTRPMTLEQERIVARVFDEFLDSPIGQDVLSKHPDVIASLRRMPFVGGLRPSIALFQTLAVALANMASVVTPDQLARTVAENQEHDDRAAIAEDELASRRHKNQNKGSTKTKHDPKQ